MLVLARRVGEEIIIGRDVRVKINSIRGNRVVLGVTAPDEVSVRRAELDDKRGVEVELS